MPTARAGLVAEQMTPRGLLRLVAVAVSTLVGCATVPPEQAARDALLWDAARECQSRFSTITSVDRIDSFGRIVFTFQGSGPENKAFVECVEERVKQLTASKPLFSPGRVVTSGDRKRTTVPIEIAGAAALVSVTVNGSERARLVLDTGASSTVLSPALLERAGIVIPRTATRWPVMTVGGKVVHVPFVRVRSLRVGALTVEDIDVGAFEAFPNIIGVDGLLGGNFLNHFKVTVDRAARRLRLDTNE